MSEFSRETLLNIIETDHVQCGEASYLARIALAAMDSEPVAYTDERNLGYIDRGRETAYLWGKQNSESSDVALYRHQQPAPVVPGKWIPVSEQMPEVGVKVLCFPVKDEPIHATFNGQLWLQDISWSGSDEPIDNVIPTSVTHWMPLPAAPQEVGDA
ncbi:DUF551 domain-containing protein [Klebsiella pneumoniae]|uniref:DUF551 domain-containing protein n=1 Tax=Klebsiella pneumoniae TaxID=573 RepID=UPI002EB500B5|nr:DUF551 domain-containing protein [Klebsiella pneumoniae]